MPDTKISLLPVAASSANADLLPIVQGSVSKQIRVDRLNRSVTNASVATQSPAAATATNIAGSNLLIPASAVIATDTIFRWNIVISKTAAGAVANTFHLRAGTAGTAADAIVLTFTTVIGTATVDAAMINIVTTVRTVGATGVLQGTMTIVKNAGTILGWINIPSQVITATSAAVNLTTAGLIFSISTTTGTGIVATVNQVVAEVVNI